MNNKINDILNEKVSLFPIWEEKCIKYLKAEFGTEQLSVEKQTEITLDFQSVLLEIFQIFVSSSNVKEEWGEYYVKYFPFGFDLFLEANKINSSFNFSVDEHGFCLSTPIIYRYNLKYMTDDFWREYLRLGEIGEFKCNGGDGFSKEEGKKFEKHFGTKKSQLFQVIRNYMLSEIFEDYGSDFGELSITWNYKISWEELILKGCEAFRLMYRLSYQLWKNQSLRNQRIIMKHQKSKL
jgi:hypothetical protein